jgi:hypothetical protein
MPPLRGLWNHKPVEGDKFVSAEIDWGVTTKAGNAVQFALSGNSPVALSQIVAVNVDNARNNVDVLFLFPDSGFVLQVPAYAQGFYPVLTNALMFYVSAPGAVIGDHTVFNVLNSMPPAIPVQVTKSQLVANVASFNIATAGSAVLVPAGVNGMVSAFSFTYSGGVTTGAATNALVDGSGRTIWLGVVSSPGAPVVFSGIALQFVNGINIVVSNTTIAAGSFASVTLYYGVP